MLPNHSSFAPSRSGDADVSAVLRAAGLRLPLPRPLEDEAVVTISPITCYSLVSHGSPHLSLTSDQDSPRSVFTSDRDSPLVLTDHWLVCKVVLNLCYRQLVSLNKYSYTRPLSSWKQFYPVNFFSVHSLSVCLWHLDHPRQPERGNSFGSSYKVGYK